MSPSKREVPKRPEHKHTLLSIVDQMSAEEARAMARAMAEDVNLKSMWFRMIRESQNTWIQEKMIRYVIDQRLDTSDTKLEDKIDNKEEDPQLLSTQQVTNIRGQTNAEVTEPTPTTEDNKTRKIAELG